MPLTKSLISELICKHYNLFLLVYINKNKPASFFIYFFSEQNAEHACVMMGFQYYNFLSC